MTISKDNTRTLITIPKELKKQLEEIAKQDNRSFSNLVVKILKDYVRNSSPT
ncbi:ribbon-helix-helix domain-containing protein [Parageobacillus galactosidasius]|uniref:DNA-binding protein n=1 Tax=Parageobacillus galactosidasius TaxID=883812 RepID=A0A226QQB0_9BACL|nr:DNA-binding protein [Parageobacillus galactosidasius]OXB94683.1 DNA-binding protein [Parageobacillus galactosidasius]